MSDNDSAIFMCRQCSAKNRIPMDKVGLTAKCGKCAADLDTRREAQLTYKLRCIQCGAKNRVPAGRINSGAVCGKCKTGLATEALSAPQPVMISDINFDQQVIKSPLPVLIYAWSPS